MLRVSFQNYHMGKVACLDISLYPTNDGLMVDVERSLHMTDYYAKKFRFNSANGELTTLLEQLKDCDRITVFALELLDLETDPDDKDEGVKVTLSPEDVLAALKTLDETPKHRLEAEYSAAASLQLIEQNWGVNMESFPPPHYSRNFRPTGAAST